MTLNLWMGNITLSHLSTRYVWSRQSSEWMLSSSLIFHVSFTKVWAHSAAVSFFCYSPASSTSTIRARPPKQSYCVYYKSGPYFGPIKTLTWRWLISSICRGITCFSQSAVNMSVMQRGLLVSWRAPIQSPSQLNKSFGHYRVLGKLLFPVMFPKSLRTAELVCCYSKGTEQCDSQLCLF